MNLTIRLFLLAGLWTSISPRAEAQADAAVKAPTVTVTGVSVVLVVPDEALLNVSIQTFEKNLAEGKAKHDARAREIQSVATRLGVDPNDIQSSRINIWTERSERGSARNVSLWQNLTIRLRDLSSYDELIAGLLSASIQHVDGLQLAVTDRKKYLELARLEAIRSARAQATTLAGEMGLRVGKPLSIEEWPEREIEEAPIARYYPGSFPPYFYPGSGLARRMSQLEYAPSQSTPEAISRGQIAFRSHVTVRFELQ
jgi:hypothetical protein